MKILIGGARPPMRGGFGAPPTAAQRLEYSHLRRSAEAFIRCLFDGCLLRAGERKHRQLTRAAARSITLISGDADGIDKTSISLARQLGFRVELNLPNYGAHGPKAAPLIGNSDMAESLRLELQSSGEAEAHLWPASWSSGTWDMMRKAKAVGAPVYLWRYTNGRMAMELAA